MEENQYRNFLRQVSIRVSNLGGYQDYCRFIDDWLFYYKEIFLKNYDDKKAPRVFIAESAPSGNYENNSNYIFKRDNLNNYINTSTDMYLYRYYRGVFQNRTIPEIKLTSKMNALVDLSKNNILIIDLLPTHGIKLNSNEREIISNNLLNEIDYTILNNLNDYENKINYAFSVPPSLYRQGMCSNYLNENFIEFGNVNTGQGHAPSIQQIREIIEIGF